MVINLMTLISSYIISLDLCPSSETSLSRGGIRFCPFPGAQDAGGMIRKPPFMDPPSLTSMVLGIHLWLGIHPYVLELSISALGIWPSQPRPEVTTKEATA